MNTINKKILIAIALVLIVVFVVLSIILGNKNKDLQQPDGSNPQATDIVYDVTGAWYSDRENGDTLTLNSDGTFTSSVWLTRGNYTYSGDTVTLTDMYKHTYQLTAVAANDSYVLHYNGSSDGHTYYRTQEEVDELKAQQQASDEEMQGIYNAALQQILTTGEWAKVSNVEAVTLQITSDTILFTYKVGGKTVTDSFTYFIASFEVIDGKYIVKMDLHDTAANEDYKGETVEISAGTDNHYTLTFPWITNGSISGQYEKTVDITFTQASGDTSGSVSPQDIYEANRTGDKTVVNDDGSVDNITQISRDDNPDDSKMVEEAYTIIEKNIYGTWKGTFADMPNAQTVYWVFTLNKNGKYSLSDDSGSTETGTFVVGRDYDSASYGTTLTLTPADGEAYTLSAAFALDSDETVTRLSIKSVGGINYPTFFKQ